MHIPGYKIEVKGANQTGVVRERLVSLTVRMFQGAQSDSLTMVLEDTDQGKRLIAPETNDEIKLWMGYEGNLKFMGTFLIDGVSLRGDTSSGDQYTVEAKAIDTLGKMFDRKYKVWEAEKKGDKIKLGDIVKKIAKDHSLQSSISKELEKIEIVREVQRRESDISFLRYLAEKHKAIVKFYVGKLVFIRLDPKTVGGANIPKKEIGPDQIQSWEVRFGNRWEFKKIKAEWWDEENAELKVEEVTNPKAKSKNAKEYIVKGISSSAENAKKMAEAEFLRLERDCNHLTLEVLGDPEIRPLTPLEVKGVRNHVDSKWLVADVTHTLSVGGYTTSLGEMSEMR